MTPRATRIAKPTVTITKGTSFLTLRAALVADAAFANYGGSFYGTPVENVPAYALGTGHLPASEVERFRTDAPSYVVYSYATPIGWRAAGEWYVSDCCYSATTTAHQSKFRAAVQGL